MIKEKGIEKKKRIEIEKEKGKIVKGNRKEKVGIFFFLSFFSLSFSFFVFFVDKLYAKYISKFGTLAPENSSWIEMWNEIAKEIEKESGGELEIKTYPGGVMGDEDEMIKKMRIGQLHSGGFTIQGMKKIAPEMGVLDLPFLFKSYDEVDYIREKFFDEFSEFFEKRGFKLLSLLDQGFIYFYSVKEVSGFSDLRKTKLWVWSGEPIMNGMAKVLGAPRIALPVPDVFTALQTGIVESLQTSPLACVSLQWCQKIKYVIDYKYRYEPAVILTTKKHWDELPEKLRQMLLNTNKKYLKKFLEAVRKEQKEVEDKLRKEKKFVKPSEEEIKALEDKVKKEVWYNVGVPKEIIDKVLSTLEEYRKKK